MAHPNDINCQWCGLPLWADDGQAYPDSMWPWHEARRLRTVNPFHGICPKKPPQTAEEGAAALATFLGMANAIRYGDEERWLRLTGWRKVHGDNATWWEQT